MSGYGDDYPELPGKGKIASVIVACIVGALMLAAIGWGISFGVGWITAGPIKVKTSK